MSNWHPDIYPRPTSDARQQEAYHDSPTTPSQRIIGSPGPSDTKPLLPSFRSSVGRLPTPDGVSERPGYVRPCLRMAHEPLFIFV